MKDDPEMNWKPFCQIWFSGFMMTSEVDQITPTYRVYDQKGPTQGFMYNCRLPKEKSKVSNGRLKRICSPYF